AAVSGRLADRYGRRVMFTTTLVIFSGGAALSALAPSFEALLVARIVAGIGLGGELPVAATLVSELSPRAQRGRMIVLLESFWAYGTILAGVVAITVLPNFGWRWAFAIGALPALYVAYLRRALPESPRYLAEKGRAPEADAIVRRVERAGGGALLTLAPAIAPTRSGRTRIAELWRPAYARRTAMLWILWFGVVLTYYGIFLWIPTLLVGRGLTQVRSNEFFFLSTLAQVPGYFSAAWLVERWGRKPTLVAYLAGTALSAVMFGNAGTGTDAFVWAALLSFFDLGVWGVVYAYTPELYPTAVRATGAGVAGAFDHPGDDPAAGCERRGDDRVAHTNAAADHRERLLIRRQALRRGHHARGLHVRRALRRDRAGADLPAHRRGDPPWLKRALAALLPIHHAHVRGAADRLPSRRARFRYADRRP